MPTLRPAETLLLVTSWPRYNGSTPTSLTLAATRRQWQFWATVKEQVWRQCSLVWDQLMAFTREFGLQVNWQLPVLDYGGIRHWNVNYFVPKHFLSFVGLKLNGFRKKKLPPKNSNRGKFVSHYGRVHLSMVYSPIY